MPKHNTQTIEICLDELEDNDIKINEKESSEYIEIEIDTFSRETLKHFKFFQTKFSQRLSKTKLQNDNKMSLKQRCFVYKPTKKRY